MAYGPNAVPTDPAKLPDFLRQELQRLSQELNSAQDLIRIAEVNVAPDKPRQGDVRLQDGTNWVGVSGGLQPVWFDGTNWQPFGTPGGPYDVGGFLAGKPSASQIVLRHVFARSASFPASLAGSKGSATAAATAQTDYDIKKNGSSIGTMRFAASATTCTFVGVSATSFAAADVISVVAPASPDATLADVSFTFKGVRT